MSLLLVLLQAVALPALAREAPRSAVPRARFDAATFDSIVSEGIARGAYPGAALVIGRRDTVLFARGYGRQTWSPSSAIVTPDSTIYDLASLTKVLATTTAIMILFDRGLVALDAPVSRYIPALDRPATADITVRQLLAHTSGLPGTLPLHSATADSAAALAMLLSVTPTSPPGRRVRYSDVNAMLLGEVVRQAAGEPLDRFATREIFGAASLAETMFRPRRRLHSRIPPTGRWRGHDIRGVVNDPNAARLGGVAGHAGAFATAMDVARFARVMLSHGALPDGRRLMKTGTVRLFIATAAVGGPGGETRALGWQGVPTGEEVSSAGTLFGPRSYGHSGWTGTSIWIDPDRDLFVVLLTNRAYAPRGQSFTVLKAVRGRVADAAARASDAGR